MVSFLIALEGLFLLFFFLHWIGLDHCKSRSEVRIHCLLQLSLFPCWLGKQFGQSSLSGGLRPFWCFPWLPRHHDHLLSWLAAGCCGLPSCLANLMKQVDWETEGAEDQVHDHPQTSLIRLQIESACAAGAAERDDTSCCQDQSTNGA